MMTSVLSSVFLASLALSCEASQQLRSSPLNQQRRRSLFFCFFGTCDDEDFATTEERDYTDCENRTDGFFGGRPIFGECGYITEVVDGWVDTNDTDGDGEPDQLVFNNLFEDRVFEDSSNATDVPASWLQIFPRDSLMWEIFGPNGDFDESIIDRAIDSIFGENTTFGRIVVTPFALDWEPVFTNTTCPTTTTTGVTTSAAPSCMTPLGSEGLYVCRTLYNPYTAEPDSKTVCIRPDDTILENNDVCGCCDGICPEEVVELECPCRCNLNGINDGLAISSEGFGDRCVSKDYGVATIGQFDVVCSTACPEAQFGSIPTNPIAALSVQP